ncbi:MAG: hypothetical protein ABF289_12305 [Clostridiales bacterium]
MHYNLEKWEQYFYENLNDIEMTDMEEHILRCEECLNKYISIVEGNSINALESIDSSAFTENILYKIEREDLHEKNIKQNFTKGRKKLFIQYIAAATITLLLTFNGYFSGLFEGTTKTVYFMSKTQSSIEGESKKFLNITYSKLGNIRIKYFSENRLKRSEKYEKK